MQRSLERPLALVCVLLPALTTVANAQDCPTSPAPNYAAIAKFVTDGCHEQEGKWQTTDRHFSGAASGEYALHGWMTLSYPKASSPSGPLLKGVKNDRRVGDTLVVTQYASKTSNDALAYFVKVSTWQAKSKSPQAYDGWFWSEVRKDGAKSLQGTGSNPGCVGCHASADNDGLTLFDPAFQPNKWTPDGDFKLKAGVPASQRSRTAPRKPEDRDKAFVEWFELGDIFASGEPDVVEFPQRSLDQVRPQFVDHSRKLSPWVTSDQCMGCHNSTQLATDSQPNMLHAEYYADEMLLHGESSPDAKANRNFSQYGEWSASLNALAGRDPVWHAQVEAERELRPQIANFTNDVCFQCHGPMAGRALRADEGDKALFTIKMFFDTDGSHAKYGALARDGVSCAVCHQLTHPKLGEDPDLSKKFKEPTGEECSYELPADVYSYTANFTEPPPSPDSREHRFWGPWRDQISTSMAKVLGVSAVFGRVDEGPSGERPEISESKLCGSCHVVLVPALPVGAFSDASADQVAPVAGGEVPLKLSFEQITYWEWRNSAYQNEAAPADGVDHAPITCQGCHMNSHDHTAQQVEATPEDRMVNSLSSRFPPAPEARRDTYKKRDGISRHILLGINYFVFEMYEQFADLLGTERFDVVPAGTVDPTVNARDWIENHAARVSADTRITKVEETGGNLEVHVEVTNFAGHKMPSGAGFRRAFLQFRVKDAGGDPLWQSGNTNSVGVLLDGKTSQPLASELSTARAISQKHHQIITSQDQAQVYETQALDSKGDIQSTVLGIYYEYKDNRILPLGWVGDEAAAANTKGQGRNLFAMFPKLVADPSMQPNGVQLEPSPTYHAPEAAKEHELEECKAPIPHPLPHVVYDPDYWENSADGKDRIIYRVPLKDIQGYAGVEVQLLYQSIPPPFLGQRFERGAAQKSRGDAQVRLAEIASRLDLGETGANWSLALGPVAKVHKGTNGAIDGVQPSLSRADVLGRLKAHYPYYSMAKP